MEKRRRRLEAWLKSPANKGPVGKFPKRKLMEGERIVSKRDYPNDEIPAPEPYPEPETI